MIDQSPCCPCSAFTAYPQLCRGIPQRCKPVAGRFRGWLHPSGRGFPALLGLVMLLQGIAAAQIPAGADRYKRDLIRNVRLEWGLDAPIASFAAQIEQESAWSTDATSRSGAQGLAQFMPATATWISGAYSALADNQPRNPAWALRALAVYDKYLMDRVSATTTCHQAAKMLSSYNGGLGNMRAEEDTCANTAGCNPSLWWENVERVKIDNRSWPNWVENRGYPPSILFVKEPRYVKAGWGNGFCQGEAY